MDWSKLLKYGRAEYNDMPDFAQLWWKNVFYYLVNHTDFSRGEKIKKKLFDGSKNKSQKDISQILRKDIDQWLITANHWGQQRESWLKEKFQNILSDAFGAIHKKRWVSITCRF